MLLFDFFYCLFILLSLPVWIKFLFKREYYILLKNRFSPDIKYKSEKRIWVHAVSVGEVKSLNSLIERLREKYKKEIVLSVTTPAGYKLARKEYKNIEVINSPFDLSFIIKLFIKRINPEILILNELEIWPNWILVTKKFNIPILLINGRISDIAFKRYKRFLFFLKHFFNKIDLFLVQDEIYKARFSQFGIPKKKIIVCGNIKADEAFKTSGELPSDRDILNFLKIGRKNEKIITLASSHLKDEELVISAINKLICDFSFIIVPRHLERVEVIKKMLEDRDIKCNIWSKSNNINLEDSVLIFDRIGYLLKILKITDIVFMGGTYEKKIGGHNLYEPAVLGKLVVGGPHYNNFPNIGKELVENRIYYILEDSDKFLEFLRNIKRLNFDEVRVKAVNSVLRRKGSIECILSNIQSLINI